MRPGRSVLLIACCLVWVGCSESTMVRSYPPAAKLYVNGQFVGLTPVAYTVDSAQFSKTDFSVRLDRTGYASVDGTLRKQTCPGRVTGGVFTLGILFIFKGPTCFSSPQDFSMEPLPGETATDAGAVHQPTIDERLDRIRKMRDQGIITNEEYEHYRKEILKDL
jgi:PEGA domain-containing protein